MDTLEPAHPTSKIKGNIVSSPRPGPYEFYKYWNNNKGAGSTKGLKASKSTFKDIGLADLIEKKPKSAVTHTVIVTGYKPLSAKKWSSKETVYVKISGSYK